MFIVSKDRENLINLEQVASIFVGSDERTIKANFANGSGCQIAKYDAPVARDVIDLMGRTLALGKIQVFFMPDDDNAKAMMAQKEQPYHHPTGKKTKGHGGS